MGGDDNGRNRHRAEMFDAFPIAAELDAALRSETNRTPLFYMDRSSHVDLRDCWWALGRLGPEIERQYGLTGEVIFLFTPYDDLQTRTFNVMDTRLRQEIAEHQKRVAGYERFSPDPNLALLWSPDPDMAENLEAWNSTANTTVAAIPSEFGSDATVSREAVFQAVSRVLGARDLYKGRNPVTGNDFFGRHDVLQALHAELANGGSVGLFGLRRSGKTSTVKEFKRRYRSQRIAVISFDLQAVGDLTEVPRQIGRAVTNLLRELHDDDRQVWIGSEQEQDVASFADLSSRLIRVAEKNDEYKFVLAIDEIEYLGGFASESPSLVRQFLGSLRSAAQEAVNVSLLLTGVTTKYFSESVLDSATGEGNPLFQFVQEEHLTPFRFEETANLVQKLGRLMVLAWDDDALADVHAISGGMPLLVRELASCSRAEAVRRGERDDEGMLVVDRGVVALATEAWREAGYRLWTEVIDALGLHHELMAEIARSRESSEINDWLRYTGVEGDVAARNLERLGLLEHVDDFWAPTSTLRAMQDLGQPPVASITDVIASRRAMPDPADRIRGLIEAEESGAVEFKDRAKLIEPGMSKADQTKPVMKTIAAFANTNGGSLLIGVEDHGEISGIDAELAVMSKNVDGYERFLRDVVGSVLNGPVTVDGIDISFVVIDGKVVCEVDVKAGAEPTWFKDRGGQTFFVREGNRTRAIDGQEMVNYIIRHF